MSRYPQEYKDPRDHDWGVERAKPTKNSRRMWKRSWQAQTHAQDETVLLCAAGGGRMLQSLSGVSFYQWKAGSLSSVLLFFCWFFFFSVAFSVSFLCVTLQSCRWSDLLHTLSCWCELVDFVFSLLTLTIHTLTLSLSLARFLIAHPFSVSSVPACPPPSFSFSLMLSLLFFHSHSRHSQGIELHN